MTRASQLGDKWKQKLGFENRRPPELYESSDAVMDVGHASAIRAALDDVGLSAVLCVQGVPTVAILKVDQYDRARVAEAHGALWNQGLASLLLVISKSTLRAFSLARKPYRELGEEFNRRCLLETLDHTADALQFRNLIYGAESGRLWKKHAAYFRPKERIDQVLLDNLKESHGLLCGAGLSTDAAQALLIQTMFIAYLEDREIITAEYFKVVSQDGADSFSSLLASGKVPSIKSLFARLRDDFNGDLFVAPCSFESGRGVPSINAEHLDVLARFRDGHEEMGGGGQTRFWGYDFRYIPIELVSAVYDRFLGEKEDRREHGAYYTPMFLADTVVSQVWDLLADEIKQDGRYLDPACGSGVFLVRSFQRMCEHWRATHKSQSIRWKSLLGILHRVHGWDVHGSAVRVAVFSLYVALLEEVSPPDIRRLINRGRILPELWNKTLVCRDFFDALPEETGFHVIVGNPPWTSRRGADRSSVRWCTSHNVPMPEDEDAWAFAWKAAHHVTDRGLVAFLLPAMSFLHNHAANTIRARKKFMRDSHVWRIVNFSDLRFQLFEQAHRSAALIIYGKKDAALGPYRFDYWVPKADLNLKIKRLITLSSADKFSLKSEAVAEDPRTFGLRLWMREPDTKLFSYLSRLPKLRDLISEFGRLRRRREDVSGEWVIGQGFKPFHGNGDYKQSRYVGGLPHLPTEAFHSLAQTTLGLMPWRTSRVHRKGFEAGFKGSRILVPQGIETSRTRLRAAYTDEPFTFRHSIQAIVIPPGEEAHGKLLTGLLNSRVAVWYAFHGTAYFGSDRPKVQQSDLLSLPFPDVGDLPDRQQARNAARGIVELVDEELRRSKSTYLSAGRNDALLPKIDRLAYEYFCLSDEEIILIEDAIEKVVPAIQPHDGTYPELWRSPTEQERRAYATVLSESVTKWLRVDTPVCSRLEASSADLGILSLSFDSSFEPYTEVRDAVFEDVLARITKHIRQPMSGNFQLMPDLRVFIGKNLYLFKPMQLRFWLRATALADADGIATDLQDAVSLEQRQGHG